MFWRVGISRISAVMIAALIVGSSLGILAVSYSVWNRIGNADSTTLIEGIQPPDTIVPLTLHSFNYVESIVGSKLILPNPSLVGSSFNIVGVRIDRAPLKHEFYKVQTAQS